jgi:SAM-dependent methyltransferase
MIEIDRCPLCSSAALQFFHEAVILGSRVRNLICTDCTLVFQSPRLTEKELLAYYAGPYRVEAQGTEAPTAQKLQFEHARARHLADVIQRTGRPITAHLDIGCAAGELLLETRQRFACRTLGIEPSIAYAEHARTQGIAVFGSLDEYIASLQTDMRPDLVSLSHVLEHLSDPVGFLTRLRESVLQPTGLLLIEVPNLFVHTSFEPAHLFAYHEGTLRETLAVAGYDVAASFTHNHPRRDPRPHYLTLIAVPGAARSVRRTSSPLGVRVHRTYARSPAALAIHHPGFVVRGLLRRITGGQLFVSSASR